MYVMPTLQALADALRVNTSVTKLELASNKFGDEGLQARPPRRGHGWWFLEQWDSEGTAVGPRQIV